MTEKRRAARIAADLQEILARGQDLSAETVRFIDATFAHPSADELSALLTDDAVPERDSLLELLFSPDEALQMELEGRLDLQPPGALAAEEVIARLTAGAPAVRFRFPDGRGVLRVAMTAPLARRLVLGLGIERRLPACVAEALAEHESAGWARRVRVMIRSARFEFTPAGQEFLCALIAKLDPAGDEEHACLAFALELLAEFGGSSDLYAALAARKKWLARALLHSQRLREQLTQSNVETLLSQGQRLTWVDEAATLRQMGHVDRICVAVFGHGVPVDTDGWRQAVDIDGPPDVAELMRRLT
jgi:hypothetical protein